MNSSAPATEPVIEQAVVEQAPIQKDKKNIFIIILFIVLVIESIGVSGYILKQRLTKSVALPTPIITITPTPTISTGTVWKTYTNNTANFSISYPPSLVKQETTWQGGHAILFCETAVIPSADGSEYNFCDGAGMTIIYDSQPARVECETNTSIVMLGAQQMICKTKEGFNLFNVRQSPQIARTFSMIGKYGTIFTEDTATKMLNSFQNTTTNTTTLTCPENGWVDCMPGPDPKPECSTEAMTWYKTNCPNFQGGAL